MTNEKIFEKMVNSQLVPVINGGNYAEHLQRSSFLYSKLLGGQGKDLYVLNAHWNDIYAVALTKKERKTDEKGEILDVDDTKELLKMFPLCSKGMSLTSSEIIGRYRIKPYTGENTKKHLTTSDLEKILQGEPVELF